MSHRWSGWPGAWCLDCGAEDANEVALAEGVDPDEIGDRNTPCPEPGSHRHDPYWKTARANRIEQLCLELAYEYHSPNTSIRNHHDPNIRTGWVVGHITTCQDVYCREAVDLLGITLEENDGEGPAREGPRVTA